MIAVAHAHPAISPFAITDGILHIGGHPVRLLDQRASRHPVLRLRARAAKLRAHHHQIAASGTSGQRDDGQSHSVPRPFNTDGAVGVDRRPPGLQDR
jgi:hypothetical protein